MPTTSTNAPILLSQLPPSSVSQSALERRPGAEGGGPPRLPALGRAGGIRGAPGGGARVRRGEEPGGQAKAPAPRVCESFDSKVGQTLSSVRPAAAGRSRNAAGAASRREIRSAIPAIRRSIASKRARISASVITSSWALL